MFTRITTPRMTESIVPRSSPVDYSIRYACRNSNSPMGNFSTWGATMGSSSLLRSLALFRLSGARSLDSKQGKQPISQKTPIPINYHGRNMEIFTEIDRLRLLLEAIAAATTSRESKRAVKSPPTGFEARDRKQRDEDAGNKRVFFRRETSSGLSRILWLFDLF